MEELISRLKDIECEEKEIIEQRKKLLSDLNTLDDKFNCLTIRKSQLMEELAKFRLQANELDSTQKRKERSEPDKSDSKKLKISDDIEINIERMMDKIYINFCFNKIAEKAICDLSRDKAKLQEIIEELSCDSDYNCLVDWYESFNLNGVKVLDKNKFDQKVKEIKIQKLQKLQKLQRRSSFPVENNSSFTGENNSSTVSRGNSFKENAKPIMKQKYKEQSTEKNAVRNEKIVILGFKDTKSLWEKRVLLAQQNGTSFC